MQTWFSFRVSPSIKPKPRGALSMSFQYNLIVTHLYVDNTFSSMRVLESINHHIYIYIHISHLHHHHHHQQHHRHNQHHRHHTPPHPTPPVTDHERAMPVSAGQQERWWGCCACAHRNMNVITPPHPTPPSWNMNERWSGCASEWHFAPGCASEWGCAFWRGLVF